MKLSFSYKIYGMIYLSTYHSIRSVEPKAMAAIKLGVVPRYYILALGERDEQESDIPSLFDSTLRSRADRAGRGESFDSVRGKPD